jgi:hypothetical protein
MLPKVIFIILNYNGLKNTIQCIESLFKIEYKNYKIILFDNNSQKNEYEILKNRYENNIIIIKNPENYGKVKGSNIGIKYALNYDPDYIMLLDNDIVVEKNFLIKLIRIGELYKDIGILSPVSFYYSNRKKIEFCGAKINWWKGLYEYRDYLNYNNIKKILYIKTDYVRGSHMLIKKNVIKNNGLFDYLTYKIHYEELDYCIRAKKLGYKSACVPKSIIYHKVSSTYKGSSDEFYHGTKNRIILWRKNAKRIHLITMLFFYTIDVISRIPKFITSKNKNYNKIIKFIFGIFDGSLYNKTK